MSHGPAKRNLELKARVDDLGRAREAALTLGARPAEVLHQRDTFFRCPEGRLKLRAFASGEAELIAYRRADAAGARGSDYRIAPVGEPEALEAVLTAALGTAGVIVKRRELLQWHNVRVHLDQVEGLGSFVELEAVLGPGEGEDEATAAERLGALRAALGVRDHDLVACAYVDL